MHMAVSLRPPSCFPSLSKSPKNRNSTAQTGGQFLVPPGKGDDIENWSLLRATLHRKFIRHDLSEGEGSMCLLQWCGCLGCWFAQASSQLAESQSSAAVVGWGAVIAVPDVVAHRHRRQKHGRSYCFHGLACLQRFRAMNRMHCAHCAGMSYERGNSHAWISWHEGALVLACGQSRALLGSCLQLLVFMLWTGVCMWPCTRNWECAFQETPK